MLDDFKNILILSIERLSKGRSNMTTIKLIRQDKTRQVRGLFYLIAAAIMVAIMGISCSSPAKPLANFSDEAVEIPVTSENQTSSQPVLTVKEYTGPIQFKDLVFANSSATVKIEGRAVSGQENQTRVFAVFTKGKVGEEYEIHIYSQNRKGFYPITYQGKNGSALFKEDGSLSMWFNNDMSDIEIYYLVK